ncbi:hypothetical protein AA0N74_08015 [Chromobacterium vaccinii]|uniref:hypothetical protein n=1 Tax=Chromobacterium vaccinii TaxID=1108595 RepID=UPI0031DE5F28
MTLREELQSLLPGASEDQTDEEQLKRDLILHFKDRSQAGTSWSYVRFPNFGLHATFAQWAQSQSLDIAEYQPSLAPCLLFCWGNPPAAMRMPDAEVKDGKLVLVQQG